MRLSSVIAALFACVDVGMATPATEGTAAATAASAPPTFYYGLQFIDLGVRNDTAASSSSNSSSSSSSSDDDGSLTSLVKRRRSNNVSSCGRYWMPVNDTVWRDTFVMLGYRTAVMEYCWGVTHNVNGAPSRIGGGQYHSGVISGGYFLTGGRPAMVMFEIHNKMDDGVHIPDYADCYFYLMRPAKTFGRCFGTLNNDTKGGTYQVGRHKISYHGLPKPNLT